jgi:hypothetical protein
MKKEELSKAYNFLSENDYIKEGNTIESDVLISLFGVTDIESMEYIGPLILLAREIERRTGLFCKLIEKCLHIYDADDGALVAKRRFDKTQRINKHTQETLKRTDFLLLSNNESRQKHMHQLNILNALNRQSKLIIEQINIYEVDEDKLPE